MLGRSWSSCRRYHPAEVEQPSRSAFGCPCCLRRPVVGSAFGASHFRGHFCVHFRYGPMTRSLPKETLSPGFRMLVSRYPAIQATRLLTLTPAGLSPPAEHASLRWTHNRTCALPRIRLSTRWQFGLDLQYSFTGLYCLGPRSAGIHRRPPGFPVPCCSSCCLPSPCKRLSRSPTTTEAPPLAKSLCGQRAARSRTSSMTDGLGSVPTFTMNRSTGVVPSFSPATSPWIRRRPSPRPPLRWLSHLHRVAVGLQPTACVASQPLSTKFELAGR